MLSMLKLAICRIQFRDQISVLFQAIIFFMTSYNIIVITIIITTTYLTFIVHARFKVNFQFIIFRQYFFLFDIFHWYYMMINVVIRKAIDHERCYNVFSIINIKLSNFQLQDNFPLYRGQKPTVCKGKIHVLESDRLGLNLVS